ncbi:outer membrane beta-barrel protein [Lewinella sp. W8]|uniref:outer membrane beta-barrel protein n=1 Tax=Lewinella sp. W8 TaxID=2528208 RepID=UPI0010686E7F|nr:outer membrane beta-barrel protein [Lewinella sp. W8]MTB53102.1 outer membrane beta-barrel protein [Lewinella sp. W8]
MYTLRNLFFLLLFAGFSSTAAAQLSVGGGIAYGFEAEEIGINVRGVYAFNETIAAQAGFIYYLVEDGLTLNEINLNGNYVFVDSGAGTKVYALAGLNFTTVGVDLGQFGSASTTETGLNVGAGAKFGLGGSASLFGEVRYVISDFDGLVAGVGVLFDL